MDCLNGLGQPPISPSLGGLLGLGDTPRPPAVSILHLFFSCHSKKDVREIRNLLGLTDNDL
ncbi:MAG: hypothetical protein V3S84_04825, partial [Dehalococcoidales bacterium]